MGEGSDNERVVPNGDSFELCGGLHLTASGHNPFVAWLPQGWPDYWLSEAGNSRSVAATALTAAGSSVQCPPALVQAWKLVTLEPLAASVSSAHASCSSASCSGERVLSTDAIYIAAAGRLTSVRAGFLLKKLRKPICGAPSESCPPGAITPSFRFDWRNISTVPSTWFFCCASVGVQLALL